MMKARVEVFERADQLWDWRLVGANGEEVCGSMQGYSDTRDARRGLARAVITLAQQSLEIRTVYLPDATSTLALHPPTP